MEITDKFEVCLVSKTRHIQKRMSQRGISQELLEIALQFGEPVNDKCVLNYKSARQVIFELERLKRGLQKVLDKGGLVVVTADESLVTTYDLDSYRRRVS